MNQADIVSLLKKYKAGTLGREERTKLESWYINQSDNSTSQLNADEVKESLTLLKSKLPLVYETKRTVLWPKLVAAAAIAGIVFGVWLYYTTNTTRHLDDRRDLLNYANDIKPGTNKATITLSNGKVIDLSEAKSGVVVGASDLKYNDNTPVISSTARDLLNSKDKRSLPYGRDDGGGAIDMTISTPRGGTYQITLSDGTKVWLNAASSLTYARGLSKDGVRRVKLDGEGYFEVAPLYTSLRGKVATSQNASRNDGASRGNLTKGRVPFIVESRGQTVEVLGTHFNINSYADQRAVKTTLLEGSVKVNNTILKPNQQSTVTSSSPIAIKQVDASEAVAWKNGYFQFNGKTLEEAMLEVSRWYNVEISYQKDVLRATPLGGTISKYGNVSQVLKKIELTGLVRFQIAGRKIIVEK